MNHDSLIDAPRLWRQRTITSAQALCLKQWSMGNVAMAKSFLQKKKQRTPPLPFLPLLIIMFQLLLASLVVLPVIVFFVGLNLDALTSTPASSPPLSVLGVLPMDLTDLQQKGREGLEGGSSALAAVPTVLTHGMYALLLLLPTAPLTITP